MKDRHASERALNDKIDTKASKRVVHDLVNAEVESRIASEHALNDKIDTKASKRVVHDLVNAEVEGRIAKDIELDHKIDTKASKKAVHALFETETQIRAEKDAALDAKIEKNADRVGKVEGKADTNRTKIEDNASWIGKVEGKADTNRTKIEDNASWIANVEGKADVNRTKISRLDTAFTNEVNTRILADQALSRDIKGNRALISTEGDIRAAYDKALDRKIAGTQAALSQEAEIRRTVDNKLVANDQALSRDIKGNRALISTEADIRAAYDKALDHKITNNTQRIEIQSKRITRNAEAIADTQGKTSELYEAVMIDNPVLQEAARNLVAEKTKLDQLQKAKAAQDKGHATLAATKTVTDKDVKDQQKRVMAAAKIMHNVAPATRAELITLANTANNIGSAMQVQINSNKAAIAQNQAAIANNTSRINHIDKREQRHMAQTHKPAVGQTQCTISFNSHSYWTKGPRYYTPTYSTV